ncbi:unnamed protein product [Dibothriocephalus latus]|uniref:Peptidase S8/S53 domain-containing protein n=1 Tax=Dibothriocephalus latus TaxID=60516 RepID=A0A3P7NRP2_DIBLA|nr:unnamed protein product [Dibothriocephalus latus]
MVDAAQISYRYELIHAQATAPASIILRDARWVTTDLNHTCTESHSGTSASAPLAAGICALTLSANPRLTWRDLQYIVIYSARPDGLYPNDWRVNGVGRRVSHAFGYE